MVWTKNWQEALMKKAKVLVIAAAALGIFTGCSKFEPDGTAVLAGKNGKVTAVVMEALDQSYYDSTELQNLINTSVAEYNASAGTEKIKVKKFQASDQKAELTMEYAGGADYAAFNDVAFFNGDILSAYDAGYSFDTTFQKIEKGNVVNASVNRSEVLNSYNYYTVILEEPMEVQVEGSLVYVSSNVEVTGKNTCRVLASGSTASTSAEETENSTMEDGTVVLSPTSVTGTRSSESELAYIMYE